MNESIEVKNKIRRSLVIIGGATGVGKTDLSIKLAHEIGGSIISADSMQVYLGFDIGSAKIRPEEMQGIRHYLIDTHDPDEEFNVFEFRNKALEAMDDIYSQGKIPIIVGGTGFYIQSVLYDIQFSDEEPDEEYRRALWKLADENGAEYLHSMLKDVDPDAANAIPANNIKRVIRALEFFKETGTRISVHNKEQRERIAPYNYAYFVLNRPREILYERINKRVDMMIEAGLETEVRNLLESSASPDCQPMKGLGYREMCSYLLGKEGHFVIPSVAQRGRGIFPTTYDNLNSCISAIKQNTRHFAKRQITWFKREKDAVWIDLEEYSTTDEILVNMIDLLKEKKIV